MNRKLNDLTCLIIGAGGKTGDLIASRLVENGIRVIEIEPASEESITEVSSRHLRATGFFQLEKNVSGLVERLTDRFGNQLAVINIITEFDADFEQLGANFSTALNWSKVLLPIMRQRSGGRIVNLDRFSTAVESDKTVVSSLTATLNREGFEDNIATRTILFGELDFDPESVIDPQSNLFPVRAVIDRLIETIQSEQPPEEITMILGAVEKPAETEETVEESEQLSSETIEGNQSVKEKETEDLMSTLGFKTDSEKPDQEPEEEKDDELSSFDIDNAEADNVVPQEPVISEGAAEEEPEKPDIEDLQIPPVKQDGPADSSYLTDSDFSNFTVDEKVISNYRTSLAEYEAEVSRKAIEDGTPATEEPPKPPQPVAAEEKPRIEPQKPVDKPVEKPVEPQPEPAEPVPSEKPQPTFYMVELYRRQGMLEKALQVLDMLENLDVDQDKLARERREINAEMMGKVPASIETKEVAAEPIPVPEPQVEEPVVEAAEPVVEPEEKPAEAAPPAETGPDEDEYERRRLEALKRRMGVDTDSEEEPEPVVEESAPSEDEMEQRRIEALKRRAGIEEVAGEEPVSEPITEETPVEPETEPVAVEDDLPVYKAPDEDEPVPAPAKPEVPLAVAPDEPDEPKTITKWLWPAVAAVVAVFAIWLLWPSDGDQSGSPELVETVESQVVETIVEPPVAAIDTIREIVESAEVHEVAAVPEESPVIEEIPVEKPVEKPIVKKTPATVKTLPLRNLKVNQSARTLFMAGDYWEAAQIWGEEKHNLPDHYTIILLFGCEVTTIKNSYRQLGKPDDFFILPRNIGGRECYTICWGDFRKVEDARQWYGEIPKWFADNDAKPIIRPFRKIRISESEVVKTELEKPTPEPVIMVPQPEPVVTADEPSTGEPETVEIGDTSVVDDKIAEAEQAFMSAMINLQTPEPVSDTMVIVEPVVDITESAADSIIVITGAPIDGDWIEMDTTTLAMEPETSEASPEFVDITDLVIDEVVQATEPEPEPVIEEPEPDYTPLELLKLERYSEAAGIWEIEKGANSKAYTIKLLVACQDISVDDAFRVMNYSEEFFILPKNVEGDNCYALCWGNFSSKKAAKKQLKEVPPWFERNGGKPVPSPIGDILD